jgi:putative toxin-antitoxin system antitoxin component (TIGR02293 family)
MQKAINPIKKSKGWSEITAQNFGADSALFEINQSHFEPDWEKNIQLIKNGMEPSYLVNFAKSANISRDRLYLMLGLSRSTIEKKIKDNELLSVEQSEKVFSLKKLFDKLDGMLPEKRESGSPTVCAMLMAWLEAPMPALNGRTPFEFMDTADGRNMVLNLLEKIEAGIYA